MKRYLYNSLANNGIRPEVAPGTELVDAVGLDYASYLENLAPEDELVLIGGDGTLNYFINATRGTAIRNNVYLLGSGTGNDFFNDIGAKPGEEVLINPYLEKLPTVRVSGMEKLFINNMGFGIDGYCCEVADQIKEKNPQEKIDYSGIRPCLDRADDEGKVLRRRHEDGSGAGPLFRQAYGRGLPLPLEA